MQKSCPSLAGARFTILLRLVESTLSATDQHIGYFLHYCLFVVFFPQLIAGPIVHHREILPQFKQASVYLPNVENFAVGGTLFAVGLFKKVVIADNLGTVATPVFQAAELGQQ